MYPISSLTKHKKFYDQDRDSELYTTVCDDVPNLLPNNGAFAGWKIAVIVICGLLVMAAIAGLVYYCQRNTGKFRVEEASTRTEGSRNEAGSIAVYSEVFEDTPHTKQ